MRLVAQAADAAKPHKVMFQVCDADPAKWYLALNNVRKLQQEGWAYIRPWRDARFRSAAHVSSAAT